MFSDFITGNPFNLYTAIFSVFAGYLTYKTVLYLMTLLGLRVTVAHANAISYSGYLCAIRPAGAALYDRDFCSGLKIIKPVKAHRVDIDIEGEAEVQAEPVDDVQAELVDDVQAEPVDDVQAELVDDVQAEPVDDVQSFVDDEIDDDVDFNEFDCSNLTRLSDLRPEDFVEVSDQEAESCSFDEPADLEEYCSSEDPAELEEYCSSDESMELADDDSDEVEWIEELSTGLIILGENDILCDDDEIDPAYWKLAV
jgi:hypothetical protein